MAPSGRCLVAQRRTANKRARSKWKWPDVPNISDFQGELVHTAAWPKDFDYKDKTVAVIGNGASGVQVLPAIKPSKSSCPLF